MARATTPQSQNGGDMMSESKEHKELRRLKAKLKQSKRLARTYEKRLNIGDRIIEVIKDAVEVVPPIEIPELIKLDGHHKEEVAILVLSDMHIGKKTATYNPKVFKERMEVLKKSMISIITALRSQRPINRLIVLFNGDIIDAESIYPAQAVDFISAPILDQIFATGVPTLTEFLLFCLKHFKRVDCYCNKGNHGRLNQSKWTSSRSTNWDLIIYNVLKATTSGQPRIHWKIANKDWKLLFKVLGHGFLATHGDMIRCYYSTPFYGMTRQATRWQTTYRDTIKLDHFIYSHFHSICAGMRFNQVNIYVNGSWITDDEFAEEKIGVASVPEQLLLGVHPKYGISWRYVLKLT